MLNFTMQIYIIIFNIPRNNNKIFTILFTILFFTHVNHYELDRYITFVIHSRINSQINTHTV